MSWLEELIVVLAYSRRTQLAIWLGFISFFAILIAGDYFVGSLSLDGPLAPLTSTIREVLMDRYYKAAWVSLCGFLLLAVKSYRKDRKKILGI